MKKLIIGVVVLGLGLAGVAVHMRGGEAKSSPFKTAPVVLGDIVSPINATGTVEPEELVDVGAQVAGQVMTFGKDKDGKTVDYGSAVEEGTILAQIDNSVYATDVAQAQAQYEQAKAGVVRSQADLAQMKAKLDQAQLDWDRAQKLGPSEALARSSYDSYKAAFEVARANLAVGEASIEQSKTAVGQAQATLAKAQRNLSYCTIKSPVKGVVIDRRVNIGQTVVSSLNAPSLFLIAKDLKRMQVWVSVSEADIGHIIPAQPVTFSVDAYPGQTFKGEVGKVRLNATMTQNVVTYTVEVITDNSDGKLLPYLTANVHFEVSRHNNVLQVPSSALRWTPTPEQISRESGNGAQNNPAPGTKNHLGAQKNPDESYSQGVLWVQDGGLARPIKVQVGISDDNTSMTEVRGDSLKEGLEVIIGQEQTTAPGGAKNVNPFTPQLRGRH